MIFQWINLHKIITASILDAHDYAPKGQKNLILLTFPWWHLLRRYNTTEEADASHLLLLLLRRDLPSTTDGGGRGLGARVLAVRDETRVTREKIRSRQLALPRTSCLRLYFRVGLSKPTPASKKTPRTCSEDIFLPLHSSLFTKTSGIWMQGWDLNLNNPLFMGDFTIFNRTIPSF